MKSRYLPVAVCVLLAVPAFARGQQLKLPESATARQGRVLIITAETKAAKVIWYCQQAREGTVDLLPIDGAKVVFVSPAAGKFLVLAFCDGATSVAECWVTVEAGPGPIPVPGELERQLRAAWEQAKSEPKAAENLRLLAELYRQAGNTTIYDPRLNDFGQLFAKLQNAMASPEIALKGKLLPLHKAIGEEFNRRLPREPGALLTLDNRGTTGQLFLQISELLGKMK